jgi:hypothetical protein
VDDLAGVVLLSPVDYPQNASELNARNNCSEYRNRFGHLE